MSGCTYSIIYGSGHTVSGSVSGCTSGIIYGSGHTVSGSVSGCYNGINSDSVRLAGATFSNNIRDLYSCITSGSATLSSTVQNGAYKYVTLPLAECRYTALVYPLGGVDGAIGCWTQGGYCKSAVYFEPTHGTPLVASALIHEQTFEDSNRNCYVELPLWLPKDAQMTVIFHGRLTGTASFLDLPRLEIVDQNGEWLTTDVLDGVQMANNTDWQTLTAVYTNTAEAREVMLRVRGTGGTETGTGTDKLYWFTEEVEIMPTQLIAAVAAIQAKTDNLPATPAATGDAMTLTAAYDAAKTAAQAGEAVILAADQPLYAPTTWRDLEAIGTPLQAEDYTAPDNAGITAAQAAAESADGKLTSERLAKLDGAAQEATVEAIKARTDTLDAATGTLTLSFRLLLDSDGDGHPDDPPVGVGGVTCHLLAHGTRTRIRESQTTDSQGWVYWHGLAAGTYDVDPDAAGYEGVTVAVTVPE